MAISGISNITPNENHNLNIDINGNKKINKLI